jgi:hypothetical protein
MPEENDLNKRWELYTNIAGLPEGSLRSVRGYADESIAIGRALRCGFNLFFKAWRDSPYDAVLDHAGILFRIEIKGSSTNSLTVTSGGRSGAQISREAEKREHILRKDDCDFLLGVNGNNGDCYIVPVEILPIFKSNNLSYKKIEIFKEKWNIFTGFNNHNGDLILTVKDIRDGFQNYTEEKLSNFCIENNIPITDSPLYKWEGFRGDNIKDLTKKEMLILDIWKYLFTNIKIST